MKTKKIARIIAEVVVERVAADLHKAMPGIGVEHIEWVYKTARLILIGIIVIIVRQPLCEALMRLVAFVPIAP